MHGFLFFLFPERTDMRKKVWTAIAKHFTRHELFMLLYGWMARHQKWDLHDVLRVDGKTVEITVITKGEH